MSLWYSSIILSHTITLTVAYDYGASCRNRLVSPFSNSSIWNMPLGSSATFVDANIFDKSSNHPLPVQFTGDTDYFFAVSHSDPKYHWYNQGHWGTPDTYEAYCKVTGNYMGQLLFPTDTILTLYGNNNAAAILQPDNVTLFQMQPLYHCNASGAILAMSWCFEKQNVSILSDGIFGCHGGSGLSSIGGTIRKGELIGNDIASIKHTLKLEFYGQNYYFKGNPSWIWPADKSDGTAHYGGNNKYFTPGALLAVPSDVKIQNLTIPGEKILFSLQNYGGYIVDDSAWNDANLCVEYGVQEEFQEHWGYPFDARQGNPFYNDLVKIFQQLKIVSNNGPNNIGGGGKPLQPIAPPICGV